MDVTAFHHGSHVSEDGLVPANPYCPLCGSVDRHECFPLQDGPTVVLLSCQGCGGASVSRMPTAATLDELYAQYYDDNAVGITAETPERLARRIAGYLYENPAALPRSLRILDFGGGNGAVAYSVAHRAPASVETVDVMVVDYDPESVVPSSARIRMRSEADLPEPGDGSTYDLVIASAVLEHVTDPMGVLRSLVSLVAPGGVLYARTPYVAPFIVATRRLRVSTDFTFPAHLHDLGQPFWDSILDRLPPELDLALIASRPSLVETGTRHIVRTIASASLKAPWRVLGRRWPYVGGWEVVIRSMRNATPGADERPVA